MKFSIQSISKLIKACKENGVAELKLGDFQLSFARPTRDEPKPTHQATIPDADSPIPKVKGDQLELFELADEFANVEDDEAMMLLEDPEELENRIASGDLVNEEKMHN